MVRTPVLSFWVFSPYPCVFVSRCKLTVNIGFKLNVSSESSQPELLCVARVYIVWVAYELAPVTSLHIGGPKVLNEERRCGNGENSEEGEVPSSTFLGAGMSGDGDGDVDAEDQE